MSGARGAGTYVQLPRGRQPLRIELPVGAGSYSIVASGSFFSNRLARGGATERIRCLLTAGSTAHSSSNDIGTGGQYMNDVVTALAHRFDAPGSIVLNCYSEERASEAAMIDMRIVATKVAGVRTTTVNLPAQLTRRRGPRVKAPATVAREQLRAVTRRR